MEQWLESVYSDGSECFVSSPQPKLFETVTVWIRMYEDAPVCHVFLRTAPNGAEKLIEAEKKYVKNGLSYYAARLKVTENRMHYHFYLVCGDRVYFYNQKEITTFLPDHTFDFVLLANYRQPEWVKSAVFYQIFPERFCNGDPDNDVRDGEYQNNGHDTIRMKDWTQKPLPYEEGFSLDFFGGDLEGVCQKIPYLKELGVTAVYLNPVFRAPSIHKYDCIDYFHVDEHFGGDGALAELSKRLHENGMRLMLDISINHTGASHRWFNRTGQFFDRTEGAYHNPASEERGYYFFKEDGSNDYLGWAGLKGLPTLNYTSQALRDIVYGGRNSVLKKWLRQPYSIDGWRFDVADVFARNDDIQLSHELWPQIRKSIREENEEAYILAEDWGDCAEYLQGSEWDSPMNYFGCGRVLRQFLGLPDLFMERNEILRKIPCKISAEEVQARVMQHLARLPFVIWQNQFNLIDSHDVPRVHNFACVNPEEYRGAVMLQFMLIGAPSIYYGDEIGIDGGVLGDEGFRYPMPWHQYPWDQKQVFQLYQTLAHLKQTHRALTEGGMKFLYAKGNVLALARFYDEDVLVVVMSTDDRTQEICLPLRSVGAVAPQGAQDIFGRLLQYKKMDAKSILLRVEAHQAYCMDCSAGPEENPVTVRENRA